MSNKKGLGRGFESLIPTELLDESFDPTAGEDERISDLRNVKLGEIEADPNQPRRYFDETAIYELAESIKEHGVVQPIVVTRAKSGKYVIVAGERRYRAAKQAGLDRIPTIVRTLSDQHRLEISLIENLQRRDLNVLETATAYLKLRDQFNMTLEQIGQRVGGKSVSAISNTLRLLRLPDVVKQALADGRLREGQARPLISLEGSAIDEILPTIIEEEWSARKIEQFMSAYRSGSKTGVAPTKTSPVVKAYVDDGERLAKRLAAKVRISGNSKGSGQIVIRFNSSDEYKRVLDILGT